jgi:threonine synthase
MVDADSRIVVLNTGNGLKDIQSAMKSVEMAGTVPYYVEPSLTDLQRLLEDSSISI